ncbi:MAG: adenylosuccinate lyase [Thermoprotei archaeon]|nr:MAG: adenylosuccinate lyase [Thermoprotei archaeon]
MPILPIDTGRYGSPEMRRIFEEESRLEKMLAVEGALALANAKFGIIPEEAGRVIYERASTKFVKLERVKELEKVLKHETFAVVKALAEACGEYGEYVHVGATSNDILDTALALQLKEALNIIEEKLVKLVEVLMNLAEKHKMTVMAGRTHGQHASPITLGLKFAVWIRELARHLQRLREARRRVLVGKMSGSVGTMAAFMGKGWEVQEEVMRILELPGYEEAATQIVQRDRIAELICLMAMIASTLDRMATEVRNLQRTEIMEIAEGFGKEQVGSSAMPHKENPIVCERVSGLAKIVRSLVIPALENMVLWHERDLTNSSSERFIVPEALILVDEMLDDMIDVFTNLRIYPDKMRRNIELTKGRCLSEAVLTLLIRRGMGRMRAYELIRKCVRKSLIEDKDLIEVLWEEPEVRGIIKDRKELEECMNPSNFIGEAPRIVDRVLEMTRRELYS